MGQGDQQFPLASMSKAEAVWEAVAVALIIWSVLAVGLAQAGLFRSWTVLAAVLLACGSGWTVSYALRPLRRRSPRHEVLFLALLVSAGFLLYSWPAEHFPQLGDSSIYPNTAAMLVRTGGLTYRYDPLDGLTSQQKQLFYVPSDKQLSHLELQSYEGLLYGAYYVMDPDQNTIVASRPTLAITWMGLFRILAGDRGMLYVTPLFGVASLVTIYFLGKRVFDSGTGALAAVWLLVSFPQLHFSRTPYAEVVGQFFVLTFLYTMVAYLQTRRLLFVPMGIAALTAALATRIDSILALATLFVFVLFLAMRRDWRGLGASVACLAVAAGFTIWTVNRPYVGATAELMLFGQLRFLQQLMLYAVPLGIGALVGLALLVILIHFVSFPPWLQRTIRWGLSLAVLLGVAYALYLRPLTPEYTVIGEQVVPTYNEELMAVAAQYVSPLLLWLAAFGAFLVLQRRRIPLVQILLLAFVLSFSAIFFWKYTTTRVYPVALRRWMPEVFPGLCLLGAFVVRWLGRRPRLRWEATAIAGLAAALLMGVSAPYWFHQGAQGALELMETLAERTTPDAVILFEPEQDNATVGWFAAPLWSLQQRDALLLNSGELDGRLLDETVCGWERQGRDVFIIAQHDPATWWPGEFSGHQEGTVSWDSSIIGQSLHFPPYIWRFAFTFSIYEWDEASCPLF
jgi:hypothetical protein